MKRKIKQSY